MRCPPRALHTPLSQAQPRHACSLTSSDAVRPLGCDWQIEQNLWKTKKLISPDSPRKARWDNWILLLVAYSAISLPMMWAFRITPSVPHLVREAAWLSHSWPLASVQQAAASGSRVSHTGV